MEEPVLRDWDALMIAACDGDQQAYRLLLQDVTKSLRRSTATILARHGQGNADVEDIVQETLLAIHLKRATWDRNQPFNSWLNAILRYKTIDAMRRRGRHTQVQIDDFSEELAETNKRYDDHAMDTDRLMRRLDPRAYRIVQMVSMEGQSAQDVAKALDMKDGAVRVALHRALKQMSLWFKEKEQ